MCICDFKRRQDDFAVTEMSYKGKVFYRHGEGLIEPEIQPASAPAPAATETPRFKAMLQIIDIAAEHKIPLRVYNDYDHYHQAMKLERFGEKVQEGMLSLQVLPMEKC